MQFSRSIKVFLSVSFALLYVLYPLNDEILKISHSLSHKISNISFGHSHSQGHTHSHLHSHSTHISKTSKHSVSHSHEILDFLGTFLQLPEKEQLPEKGLAGEKFDKHLFQEYASIKSFREKDKNPFKFYQIRNYSYQFEIPCPPPEFSV